MAAEDYGDPLERDARLVFEDVLDEFISIEHARDVYGVVIDVVDRETLDFRINEKETSELRN